MNIELSTIVIDCANPAGLGRFWCAATGYVTLHEDDEPLDPDDTWVKIGPKDGGTAMAFQRVPEPKTVKNRVHVDFLTDDEEAEAARLEGLGARRLWVSENPDDIFIVLGDPEGNEFCLVRRA